MRLLTSPDPKLSTRQVSIAAENIAAAQFALCGFDVLEQARRARFFYDLGVAKSGGMIKVSVHGSLHGFWDLVDPYLPKNSLKGARADYHRAIDQWLERHSTSVVCCLVKFESSDLAGMPRMYLASAAEVADKLHQSTEELGDTALYEQYELTDAAGRHSVETLPAHWRFSQARIAELMAGQSGSLEAFRYRFSDAPRCVSCAAEQPASCVHCLPMMN